MLSGAFSRLFDAVLLISGDADFVPVVKELQRLGVKVFVACGRNPSEDLLRAADRRVMIVSETKMPELIDGKGTPFKLA